MELSREMSELLSLKGLINAYLSIMLCIVLIMNAIFTTLYKFLPWEYY